MRAKPLRTIILGGSLITLVGLAVVFALRVDRGSPEESAKEFLELVRSRDWGGIYDQAPPTEFANLGLTRDKYITFVSSLAQGLPESGWEKTSIDWALESRKNESEGVYAVMFRLPFASVRPERSNGQMLHVHRLRTGWSVSPAGFPLLFATIPARDKLDSCKRLLTAMKAAGIERFPTDISKTVLSRRGLEEYLTDSRKDGGIYIPR